MAEEVLKDKLTSENVFSTHKPKEENEDMKAPRLENLEDNSNKRVISGENGLVHSVLNTSTNDENCSNMDVDDCWTQQNDLNVSSSDDSRMKGTSDPATPSNTNLKKRKRMTPEERIMKEKEREEKRIKLEQEKKQKELEKNEKLKLKLLEKQKKEEERLKKEEERQKEKAKREEERLQEKAKREEERLQEKAKKEEERMLEKAKKDEEKRKREQEKAKKEEERLEEKMKKEEERKKKEEERRKKLEKKEEEIRTMEMKKAKQAAQFSKFFVPVEPHKRTSTSFQCYETNLLSESDCEAKDNSALEGSILEDRNHLFQPFEVKSDMTLAPICKRNPLSSKEKESLERLIASENEDSSKVEYLKLIKDPRNVSISHRTVLNADADVQVVEKEAIDETLIRGLIKWRWKLLQFEENRRPPYWGTWKKRTTKLNGRRPFSKETNIDYEFDSDEEWEQEPEDGEDIANEDDEVEDPDNDNNSDGDEDNEDWMVPHGYLSDSELGDSEHLDKQALKNKESEFFNSLNSQLKMGYPCILTKNLDEYKTVFVPGARNAARRSFRMKKKPSQDSINSKTGFLSLNLPSDDDEDSDWERDSSESDEENISSSDDSYDSSDYESEQISSEVSAISFEELNSNFDEAIIRNTDKVDG